MPKAIETIYKGSGATTPSRITASDSDGNRFVLSSCGSRDEDHRQAAEGLRGKMQWSGELIGGGTKRGMVWVFATKGRCDKTVAYYHASQTVGEDELVRLCLSHAEERGYGPDNYAGSAAVGATCDEDREV